ncbi:MAG: phosphatidate cytidylyltransferase [Candidatus Goldbacteria bacterium]|nr:phosphatidate cytidylyltransferase [Candidatus Goldiibacteriota bacterium]
MLLRIIMALIILPFLYVIIFLKNPYFFIGLAIIALTIALNEIYLMLNKRGLKPFLITGNIFALILYYMVILNSPTIYFFGFIALFLILSFTFVVVSKKIIYFQKIISTIMPVIYIGFLGLFGIKLRLLENGAYYIFILLFITYIYDAGAYFIGSSIGKHKLIPSISPGKTIEGCLGGLITALFFTIIIHYLFLPKGLLGHNQLLHLVILSIVLSITGQIGDISASLVKRFSNVKNSSDLIPGHGGILDKIDSSLFNAPVLFFYLKFFII